MIRESIQDYNLFVRTVIYAVLTWIFLSGIAIGIALGITVVKQIL